MPQASARCGAAAAAIPRGLGRVAGVGRGSRMPTLLLLIVAATSACAVPPTAATPPSRLEPGPGSSFGPAAPIDLAGYDGMAMEPFLTRDGRYLFFNDSNDPSVDTDLHWAERRGDLDYAYRGRVAEVNSSFLDGVPSIDAAGVLYFVSPRSYGTSFATIHRAQFTDGVAAIELVPGVSLGVPGMVQFDVEVAADGNELIFADGEFARGEHVPRSGDLQHAWRRGDAFVRDAMSQRTFAAVNTRALEYAGALSADGLELFFTRADPARGELPRLYRAVRAARSEPFGGAVRLAEIEGFVEAPTLGDDGRLLCFHRREPTGFRIYCARRSLPEGSAGRRAEHKVDSAEQTERGPEVVEAQGFAHVDDREGDEHREGDDLLEDLQLRQR